MRVLALPRYAALGASSRLRLFQYLPAFRSAGVEVDVAPFLGDDYIRGLYAGRVPLGSVFGAYARRAKVLRKLHDYDAVWLQREIFPWLPFALDIGVLARNTRVMVDYDDAVFHRYDSHRSRILRSLLGTKIDRVMAAAEIVAVGNEYLAQRALAAGCQRIERLPTVVDLSRYALKPVSQDQGPVVVGWIGSPATASYLRIVTPVLEDLVKRLPVRCVAIGARPDQVSGTPFEIWPWSEQQEVALIQRLDIGIMPLPDDPFEQGKCGYKLIQYMACGLPVVASPVGINRDIVSADNGYLASSDTEWSEALERLIQDSDLRVRLGRVGRRDVERTYCLAVQAPRFIAMVRSLAAGRG